MSEKEVREVSVQEGYALWADSYDREENGLIILEERQVDRLLAPLSFTHVLDVGAGTGRHALKLVRRGAGARGAAENAGARHPQAPAAVGARVTAVDQSPQMLALARQAAQSEGLSINFHLLSLEDGLPFEANQFDLLICALTLCHVPNLARVVGEFARVLQPGGFLLITDFHPIHTLYGWRTAFQRAGVTYHLPTIGHTREDYLEAITASGLTILEVTEGLVGEMPEGAVPEEFRRAYADKPFCLSMLAQKPR
ncbi:MAG TPA: class I SAM-dependent methyltransferase [Ktedonobacterales bacterium]|nr:class I SAM-dependent methyltransferase [Ktedonobacterales bacterium]